MIKWMSYLIFDDEKVLRIAPLHSLSIYLCHTHQTINWVWTLLSFCDVSSIGSPKSKFGRIERNWSKNGNSLGSGSSRHQSVRYDYDREIRCRKNVAAFEILDKFPFLLMIFIRFAHKFGQTYYLWNETRALLFRHGIRWSPAIFGSFNRSGCLKSYANIDGNVNAKPQHPDFVVVGARMPSLWIELKAFEKTPNVSIGSNKRQSNPYACSLTTTKIHNHTHIWVDLDWCHSPSR